jgi:hypothetical protein
MRSIILALIVLAWTSGGVAAGPAWGPPGWQNAPLDPSSGPPPAPAKFWMLGSWTGTGSQSGTGSSWTIALNVQQQGAQNYYYKIDYPSLDCGGYWSFNSGNADTGTFTEHIVYGRDKCIDLGTITVGAVSGSDGRIRTMAFHWTGLQPNGRQDNAGATLTRN